MIHTNDKTTNLELEFLRHSNLIEGEGDDALADSVEAWMYLRDLTKLTEHDILHAHKLIGKTRDIRPEDLGVWTRYQTSVGGRNNPEPWKVPALMAAWIDTINASLSTATPWPSSTNERKAKHLHVRFEHTHPFCDINGRVGRMLLNWHRLRLGMPITVIHSDTKSKKAYYDWF